MTTTPPDQQFDITDEAALRSMHKDTHPLAVKKCLPELDKYCRDYIERSPFLCLSTQHADGTADVSPRGDPAGFVQIINNHVLAIPDRPGNNRLDSLSNILSNPSVGILFLIPGFEDTLRVNGRARLSQDPALLSSMQVNGKTPTLAIVVEVKEAFLHCAKALRRAKIWSPESLQDRSQMQSLAAIVTEQTSGNPVAQGDRDDLEKSLEDEYRNTMY